MAFICIYASACSKSSSSATSARCARSAVSFAAVAVSAALLCSPDIMLAAGMTASGRLDRCKGDEACISTSSVGNPVKFAPPWTYESQTNDADAAWASLKNAISQSKDHGEIVESRDGPSDFYLRAEFPSFGKGKECVFSEERPT